LSRILAYTSPAQGHLNPAAAVLLELRRRGHEVALRTRAGGVAEMSRLGLAAAPIAAAVEAIEMDDWRARTPLARMRRGGEVLGARARHEVSDLLGATEEVRPDALLVDVLSLGALSAAEAWGGPWACFSPLVLPIASRHSPPMGPGLRPANGRPGRARDRALRKLHRVGFDLLLKQQLNELRTGLGLARFDHTEELYLAPPLVLYMTAEPFEYARDDWPVRIRMVGPCSWDPPGELPTGLDRVELPLVLVSTSSDYQDDGSLVVKAIEALEDEPVHLVATVPPTHVERLPRAANATVLEYAPHTPILERAICAVTHGGMGVTQKALARGVPVCAVPFGRDQLEVARRVELSGAGSRLPARRLDAKRLRRKVHEAISRRAGAERVAAAFATSGGARAAADAFEDMLEGRAAS
jgi:MGT family glycosyltransferase